MIQLASNVQSFHFCRAYAPLNWVIWQTLLTLGVNAERYYINDLFSVLTAIAESEVGDVREVIDYYRTFDDPLAAFRENQRKAHEQEVVLSQKAEEERQQRTFASSWTSSFLRRR